MNVEYAYFADILLFKDINKEFYINYSLYANH